MLVLVMQGRRKVTDIGGGRGKVQLGLWGTLLAP